MTIEGSSIASFGGSSSGACCWSTSIGALSLCTLSGSGACEGGGISVELGCCTSSADVAGGEAFVSCSAAVAAAAIGTSCSSMSGIMPPDQILSRVITGAV